MANPQPEASTPLPLGEEDEEMVVPVPISAKRNIVNEDEKDLPDPKRARANADVNIKLNAMQLLLHWHEYLAKTFKITDKNNIDNIADITFIIYVANKKFRQDSIGQGSMITKISDNFKFRANHTDVEWRTIKDKLKTIASYYGFNYLRTDGDRNATGTLDAIVCLFELFRPRCNEIMIGTTKITYRKTVLETISIPNQYYGLNASHSPLLYGCTFNPTLQSRIKKTLGPMTIAIKLCQEKDRTRQDSWKEAFNIVFKWFPNCNDIAYLLAGSGFYNSIVLETLADIALLKTVRSLTKASFPFAMVLCVANTNTNYKNFFKDEIPNTPITQAMTPTVIQNIDFSRAGAYKFWAAAREAGGYKMSKRVGMTARTMREIVFHATWCTQREDLGLLKWMTGHDFQTREEMDTQFAEERSGSDSSDFNLIPFKRVCKLANAAQYPAGSTSQCQRVATFSGRCQQRVNLDDAILKSLQTRRAYMLPGSTGVGFIIQQLRKIKEQLLKDVPDGRVIHFGTTPFFKFDKNAEEYGPEEDEIAEYTKVYFYEQDSIF